MIDNEKMLDTLVDVLRRIVEESPAKGTRPILLAALYMDDDAPVHMMVPFSVNTNGDTETCRRLNARVEKALANAVLEEMGGTVVAIEGERLTT